MKMYVLVAALLTSFAGGGMIAFPAIINPAILSPNSTDIRATSGQASWIASANGFSGVFGFFILSPVFQIFGRKAACVTMNVIMGTGWLILILGHSVTALVVARAIQGLCMGGVFITAVSLSEYASPSRRGYFMALKKMAVGVGSLVCHSLGLILNWRQISGFFIIPLAMSTILVFFWPESPAFLAMKGRFNECEKSFVWLNGNSINNKKELKELIRTQMERLEKIKESNDVSQLMTLLKKLKNKEMMKSCLIVTLTVLCIDACGRYFLLAYMTQILTEITGSQPISMYCSIVSDLLLISALLLSCLIIKSYNRRTLLFGMGSVTVASMIIISLAIVLKSKYEILLEVTWLIPSLILLQSFLAHIGIIPVAFAISAEVFPLELRGLCSCISGIGFTLFYAATLKFTPLMIESTGVSGTYAIYASIVILCLLILYFILPETKDRTLQDIENEIKGKPTLEGLGEELLEHNSQNRA